MCELWEKGGLFIERGHRVGGFNGEEGGRGRDRGYTGAGERVLSIGISRGREGKGGGGMGEGRVIVAFGAPSEREPTREDY